jgi:hypothetical protein
VLLALRKEAKKPNAERRPRFHRLVKREPEDDNEHEHDCGEGSHTPIHPYADMPTRRHADPFPLRCADAKFLQTTVKGASAQSQVFGGEQGISVVPGQRTVDQE